MRPRVVDTAPCRARKWLLALATPVRLELDDRIHALDCHERSIVARMPGLPPTFRRLVTRRHRRRGQPVRPSEDGGFDVELCGRRAN